MNWSFTYNILDPNEPTKWTWPEVEIEETNGFYIACNNNESINLYFIKGSVNYDNEFLRTHNMTTEVWLSTLDDVQIEAGIQIFYDLWNFCTGSVHDKNMHEVFQSEKRHRMNARAPGTGDLKYDIGGGKDCGKMMLFDGVKWIEVASS